MQWDIPGADHYLSQVVDSLAERKHVVLTFPEPIAKSQPLYFLKKKLQRIDFGHLSIFDNLDGVDLDSFEQMINILGAEDQGLCSFTDIFKYNCAPSKFLAIDLTTARDEKLIPIWIEILKRAGDYARNSEDYQYQLVLAICPTVVPPPEDLYLEHHAWWGILSHSDFELIIDRAIKLYPPTSTAEHYWLRALCRGIGGSDIDLITRIVEERPDTYDKVLNMLSPLPQREVTFLGDFDIRNIAVVTLGQRVPPCPKEAKERLVWEKGWFDWFERSGYFVHSALLMKLGFRDEISRRICFAQQDLLWPVVERIRLLIIDWIERHYGGAWADTLIPELSSTDRENVGVEIGSLAHHLFRRGSKLQSNPLFSTLSSLAWVWRNIRNGLAHGKFISLATLESAWAEYRDLERKID